MRRLFLAVFLFVALLPRSASATEWELELQAGLGAFIGQGWDANQLGGAYAISAGPRLTRYFALHGLFLAQHLRLRTAENNGEKGGSFGLMLAPYLYPLGRRHVVEPYFSPLAGVSYTSARIDEGAEVELSSRAALLGAKLGGVWWVADSYGVGLSGMIVRLFMRKACLLVEGGQVSCDALGDTDTRLVTFLLTFRASFGENKAP